MHIPHVSLEHIAHNKEPRKGKFIARFAPLSSWTDDPLRKGLIPVIHLGDVVYARPNLALGTLNIPTREFVKQNYSFTGVICEELIDGMLVWDGITYFPEADLNQNQLLLQERFQACYPYVKMVYFDEKWSIVSSTLHANPTKGDGDLAEDEQERATFKICFKGQPFLHMSKDARAEYLKLTDLGGNSLTLTDGKGISIDDSNDNHIFTSEKGIKIFDKFKNFFESFEKGIVIKDKFENQIIMDEEGIHMKDKFGHVFTMEKSGTKLDEQYILLEKFLDFWDTYKSNHSWDAGMMTVVQMHPAGALPDFSQTIAQKNTYKSDKEGS